MARGLVPDDIAMVGGVVEDICYRNAVRYLDIEPLRGSIVTDAAMRHRSGATDADAIRQIS